MQQVEGMLRFSWAHLFARVISRSKDKVETRSQQKTTNKKDKPMNFIVNIIYDDRLPLDIQINAPLDSTVTVKAPLRSKIEITESAQSDLVIKLTPLNKQT
jgi:hypothetical protein